MIYRLLRPLKLYRLFWAQLRLNPADARAMVWALAEEKPAVMKLDRLANLRGWLAGLAVRYVMGASERAFYHREGCTDWPTEEQWSWLTMYLTETGAWIHIEDVVELPPDPTYTGGVAHA